MSAAACVRVLAATVAIFCGLSLAQLTQPAHPSRWDIFVEAGKGYFHGAPVCHPLRYFSGSPLQFDYDNDLYGMKPDEVHANTDVKELGTVGGRRIVQVIQNINNGDLMMKRLLVQRRGEEFCAIYQQQYAVAQVQVRPATIETVSGEVVLATGDPNGNHGLNQAYWTFDAHGPMLLDTEVIDKALKQVLPPGDEVRDANGLDIRALCYRSLVWKDEECHACASGGTVTLKLGFQDHRLVVLKKVYDPNGTIPPSFDLCKAQ